MSTTEAPAPTGEHPPLPEAPASATLKVNLRGYEVLFTLRDHSGRELLAKLGPALDALEKMGAQPVGRQTSNLVSNINEVAGNGAPLCPTHAKPMKQSQHGGWFCTVKVADDDGAGKPVYCKQKVKA